jgi:predicted kinase
MRTTESQDEIDRLRAEIARLREAVRRLADQDATLSVQAGNVTVTMDATLTDDEREAVEAMAAVCEVSAVVDRSPRMAATLRGLLERTK